MKHLPTTRSFLKYLITISLLLTIILNIKFKQQLQDQQFYEIKLNSANITNANTAVAQIFDKNFLLKIIRLHNDDSTMTQIDNEFRLVLLIQVHKRLNYLKKLIESINMLNRNNLNKILVIYSHDYYDTDLNLIIKNESKFNYKQIFYPYMLQLYENQFPGNDPNDCPKAIKKYLALRMRCNNAAYPDSYGNYREFNIVQIKHHWFWKLAFVFDSFKITKFNQNFGVLLLEEDYYLMPDSLVVLEQLKNKILTDNDIVSLAYFDKHKQNIDYAANANKFGRALWNSANHNTGLYITRSIWNKIKDCSNEFCTYDDYNWDWTLQYVGQSCLKSTFFAIFPIASRVIHIGECGTHHKGPNCDPSVKVNNLLETIEKNSQTLFPKELKFVYDSKLFYKLRKSNGGWSDLRDHMLCKSFINYDIKTSSNIITAITSTSNNLTTF